MRIPHVHHFIPVRVELFDASAGDLSSLDAKLAKTLRDLLATGPHTITVTTLRCTKCPSTKYTQSIAPTTQDVAATS